MSSTKAYSLFTILNRVKSIINEHTFNKSFWVKTQISKVTADRNGNYYLELIESKNGNVIAKCNATIWADQFLAISNQLKDAKFDILKNGAEILCLATIDYSEKHGLKLSILEIDLNYNLGEIEKRKQQNLLYLKNNGLLQLNKSRRLPILVQKIALIGSPNTAGFTDFIKQVEQNKWHFKYKITVFASSVQGDKASADIINAMEQIDPNTFDAIVIVRGGGSKFDLDIFNDLPLAIAIANSKIPVLTGIGHETDTSIADVVAHSYFKTPTALAAFVVELSYSFLHNITNQYQQIVKEAKANLKHQTHTISFISEQIKNKSLVFTQQKTASLQSISNKIGYLSFGVTNQQKLKINAKKEQINYLSRNTILNDKTKLHDILDYISIYKNQIINEKHQNINQKVKLLNHFSTLKIVSEKNKLEQLEQIPKLYSPQNILNLGYAIVRKNNKVIVTQDSLKSGDLIEIELATKTLNITIKEVTENIKWKDILTKELQKN